MLLARAPPRARRYDSHRDQILRSGDRYQAGGGATDGVSQRPPDEEDLFQYFTSAAYSGYGDGPKVGGWRTGPGGTWGQT